MPGQTEPDQKNPVLPTDGVLHHGEEFRCGLAAIIGPPNVGKSTLLNTLLGQKVSIVSPKPQTTRHRLSGILSSPSYQIVFLDTPGLLKAKYLLHRIMMEHAFRAMEEADVLLFMVDARKSGGESWLEKEEVLTRFQHLKTPAFLLMNKVDLVRKPDLLPLIDRYSKTGIFREIFPLSALKNDGTEGLLASVVSCLPPHPPLYPLDTVSAHSERFLVSEIIREKVFLHCREEVPYSTAVSVVEFTERETAKTLIRAEVYVERATQRGIVIGRNGSMLKRIGEEARGEIEELLDHPVFLELRVKVREEWRRRSNWLDRLGYESGLIGPEQ